MTRSSALALSLLAATLVACGGDEGIAFEDFQAHCPELEPIAVELRGEEVVERRPSEPGEPQEVDVTIDGRDASNEQVLCDYVFEQAEGPGQQDRVRFMLQRAVGGGELSAEQRQALYAGTIEDATIEDLGDEAKYGAFPTGAPAMVKALVGELVVTVEVTLPFGTEPGPFVEQGPLEQATRGLVDRLDA